MKLHIYIGGKGMHQNPLKEQLTKDIHDFRENRKPKSLKKQNLWVIDYC